MRKHVPKNDKYRDARGGYSRLLEISCRKCGKFVTLYQKDGSGNLRRIYIDRIISPKHINKLNCPKCKEILGTPYIYKKENRKAFRLYQDAITKKIVKLDKK